MAMFRCRLPILKIYNIRNVNYKFSVQFTGSEYRNMTTKASYRTLLIFNAALVTCYCTQKLTSMRNHRERQSNKVRIKWNCAFLNDTLTCTLFHRYIFADK